MRFPISRPVKAAFIFAGVLGLLIAITVITLNALDRGPEQPVPFSHKIHAGTKEISCFFCHQYATVSSNAGLPSVDKCVLCHQVIATQFPPIKKIFDYQNRNEGIPWVRVNRVPDFVHFQHQAHLARGFDCSRCHGDVKNMDRIMEVNKFNMGFCVECHRENGASVDCYTCHW